jgi:CheY-like chemotaxis protein/nitrogen-specific signal transduction histidine kinase
MLRGPGGRGLMATNLATKRKKTRRKPAGKRKAPPRRRASATDIALASLAHEIRTPLTGILALAELLHASDLPEREQCWAEAIRGAADHLARLTSLVVDSAKADSTGFALREEVFSPRDLARSVAGLLTARAESKGLEVASEIADGLPSRVIGDVVRLRGALENLIDNALKFTDRGRVAFAVSSAGAGRGRTRLTFAVTDSGIGIKPAELKRLFHPFAQANADIARRYGGAGLGLMFVKRTAEAMGGGLKVSSKPQHGSTFRMTVIVRNETAVARQSGGAAVITGLRVLCVEDNPYGRVVLGTVLRELGHSVSFVGRGEAAVETAAHNGHDVVLMDVALPGDVDGIEATRRIRALPGPAGRTPIIGVSGRSEADDEKAARAAGMDAYLRKPASPAELHAALQEVARVRRAMGAPDQA